MTCKCNYTVIHCVWKNIGHFDLGLGFERGQGQGQKHKAKSLKAKLYLFFNHWGIGDFRTFVSISLFSQFSYNQQPICTILGEMTDSDEIMHPQFWDGSRLIRMRIADHFCFYFWRWRSFALSITDRISVISKIQNVWSHWRRRLYGLGSLGYIILVRSIENGISDICCFRGVILSPYNGS